MVTKKLNSKVAIITGASSGLGLTISDFLYEKGLKIAVCSRNISKLKKRYKDNKRVLVKKADLTKMSEIKNFLSDVKKKFSTVDYLINNAGIAIPSRIEKLKIKDLENIFKVNLFAPSMLLKNVSKIMRKKNFGRIINISSGGAINCAESYFAYSASKAALNTLTKTAAKELENYNIFVNSMSPGPCKTKMFPKNPLSHSLTVV